ncbi:MAG: PQQ-binding-like beta-propeller repeat protein [Ignavibacteriales bacterium]|nr:PQQ-binding-like beta-propeller repeat protein [Ignavibacteriales bacterium]
MKKFFNIFLIVLFGLIGCKDKSTNPKEELPPGYQQDIPWPSLADSPWPMNHHDPQSTGRSKFAGPKLGLINWEIDSIYMRSGVSVGPDSTIYFVSIERKGLFAVRPDGKIKWILKDVVENGWVYTTPLIASDGTIYIGGGLNGKLYAISPDGKIKWELKTLGFIYHVGLNIGKDGTIYLLNGDPTSIAKLVAIKPTGKIDWYFENPNIDYGSSSGTAISPDGNTIYVPGIGPSIFAIDLETHQLKWSFGNSRYQTTPIVDSYGNIYLVSKLDSVNSGNASVFCIKPDGKIKWSYKLAFTAVPFHFISEGTIDKNGNYYFALDTVYSFNFNGNINWKLNIGGYYIGFLINDFEGDIYFTVDFSYPLKYYKVDNKGNLMWTTELGNQFGGYSPAIGTNKNIYIPTFKSAKVFSIK